MALLPPEAMNEIAKVLGFGANKYTNLKDGFVEWINQKSSSVQIIKIERSRRGDFVALVMKNGSRHQTQGTLHVKEKYLAGGIRIIEEESKSITERETQLGANVQYTDKKEEKKRLKVNTESVINNGWEFWRDKAVDALSVQALKTYTQTIATTQGMSEEYYVVSATTAWDFLEIIWKEFYVQLTTLGEMNDFINSGYHNWRDGLDWTRVSSAVLRHLSAWHGGEDIDPESGLSHLAHAGCGIPSKELRCADSCFL